MAWTEYRIKFEIVGYNADGFISHHWVDSLHGKYGRFLNVLIVDSEENAVCISRREEPGFDRDELST
eukprot:711996-Ditylum_brightwellii.AAC.1